MSESSFKADLHIHSTFSDGTCTPEEILDLAMKTGLQAVSITDHDSVAAYPKVIESAKEKGIIMITGVEFSAAYDEEPVHILGYGFDPENSVILSYCSQHTKRRRNRNREILELLAHHRLQIKEEDLFRIAKSETIGRPHIALAMMEKGYVESINEAFKKYIGDGKCCYVPGVRFSVEETIDVIHHADGFAFIAHPHLIKKKKVIKKLLEMNFDGLEGRYARFTPKENEKWINLAREHSLMVSGGSDFHGDVKPHLSLGCSYTDEETFNILSGKA